MRDDAKDEKDHDNDAEDGVSQVTAAHEADCDKVTRVEGKCLLFPHL